MTRYARMVAEMPIPDGMPDDEVFEKFMEWCEYNGIPKEEDMEIVDNPYVKEKKKE